MLEDIKPNLAGVKAGDWIWVEYMRFGTKLRRYEQVTRLTSTRIIAGRGIESRYDRRGGFEIGGGAFSRCTGIATQEEREAFDREQAIAAKREARLDQQEKDLRRRFGRRKEVDLHRRGDRYEVHFYKATHAEAIKIAEALKR